MWRRATSISAYIRRSGFVVMALCAWPGCVTPGIAQPAAAQERAAIDAVLFRQGAPRRLEAHVVAAWNEVAHDIAVAEDQFLTFKGQRALAMMHLAMHDALNSIVPVYQRFAYSGEMHAADPTSAAAQAAHDVLVSLYPNQQALLADQLAKWLSTGGDLQDRGVRLGKAAAAANLAARADDGWDFQGTYEFREGPGQYQTTPPWNGLVAQPGFRAATPFALEFPHQLRQPPPPPLTSRTYARALREVQEYGAVNSTKRTEDQTAYAVWWMEFAEGSVNRLARRLVIEHGLHLWAAARLFAHVGIALYDGYIAVWDSKYEYNHWRPYTAVRAAESDGNPRTTPDETWEPLRPTPPFPEYVSAHATACASSFEILSRTLGRHVSFTMETTTAPPGMPTRSFGSFEAAARECADSRVRLGWHFRYATDAGLALGKDIARLVLRDWLRERKGRDEKRP
jgi:hypothetical protein